MPESASIREQNFPGVCSALHTLPPGTPPALTPVGTSPRRTIFLMPADAKSHWENVYANRAANQVSWYRPHLEASLDLILRAAPNRDATVVDVGGGESTLVDDLLDRGYSQVTVLDVSEVALQATRDRLGAAASRVQWQAADITQAELAPEAFDVWHDRAVFHFLTQPWQREAYVRQVVRSVKRGGHVIVGTFASEGPTRCSGLEVVRYKPGSLHGEFGSRFRLVESHHELHHTPSGAAQPFLYCYCRVE